MKHLFTLIMTLLLMTTMSFAQKQQQGYVKTRGRLASNGTLIPGQRLSGASVILRGGNTVVSGNKGTFSLLLPSNQYYLQNIQKQGYVVADPDILSKQYAYSANPMVLVMETPDNQKEDKLNAEKKIRRTLQKQLQDKEDEIEELKEQNKITKEEYQKAMQKVYADQENNENLISEMAKRYSTIDYDQQDKFNLQISKLILEGKLFEADSLLNTKGDILTRTAILRQHQTADKKAEEVLNKRKIKYEKKKKMEQDELVDIARDCYSKFEICKIRHQYDSAAYYVQTRASLDSLNLDWTENAADFMATYLSDYKSAVRLKERNVSLSTSLYGKHSAEYAICLNNLGTLYTDLGQYEKARLYYSEAYDILASLGEDYYLLASLCTHSIGSTYSDMHDYETALRYYTNAIDLLSKVSDTLLLPKVNDIKGNVYNSMGYVYHNTQDDDKAEYYYTKAKELWYNIYSEEDDIITVIDNNIAGVLVAKMKLSEARTIYEKSLARRLSIYGENNPKVANSYNNIANLCVKENKLDSALFYQTKANDIWERTYGRLHPIVGNAYGNMANILNILGKTKESIGLFKKAYEIASITRGEDQMTTQDLLSNIDWVIGEEIEKNPESDLVKEYKEFRKNLVYVASIPKTEQSPAYQLGMQGDYYFIKYNDWDINSNKSMLIVNEQCKGKPKKLLFYKDGKLLEHSFENMIGARIYVKRISSEEYKRIESIYNNWEKE